MKKTNFLNNLLSTKARKAIASTLALSMMLSGAAYATTSMQSDSKAIAEAAADATGAVSTFVNGDIDGDGKVTLADAQLALKGALKIKKDFTEAQLYAADVDSNDKVDLTDAQLILKDALKIKDLPEKAAPATPTVPASEAPASEAPATDEPDATTEVPATATTKPTRIPEPSGSDLPPSKEPKPVLPAVPADPQNVVEAQEIEILNLNTAQVTGDGVIVFGPMKDATGDAIVGAEYGVEIKNPVTTEFCETIEEVIRTEGRDGKQTVWELSGASVLPTEGVDLKDVDQRVSNAEPQGHTIADLENIEYTRPEWQKGVSFSFWVNTESVANGDPILTFANDQTIFSVKLNGSVRFIDSFSTKERNSFEALSDEINGGFDGWAHYTITIKNDWIQVYVNGQENVYNKVLMNRSKMGLFNSGFMTRYNPITVVDQEMADNDIRKYYTGIDSTGHSAWYMNPDTGLMEGHDDFSIFVNKRFMGGQADGQLLMDFLSEDDVQVWIGGTVTAVEPENTARQFSLNTNVADLKFYSKELTPQEAAACFEYDTTTPEAVEWDPNYAPAPEGDDPKPVTPSGIDIVKIGNSASYDKETDIITFSAPAAKKPSGVEVVNPFANRKDLRETLQEALAGQDIFPYLADNGGTIPGLVSDGSGCTALACEVRRGNFYDVYYGDVALPGDGMSPATGTNDHTANKSTLMSEADLEATYGNQKTTFQRPKWNKGASISFWAKPVEVDDSPLLTFYANRTILIVISVRGDVCYYNLNSDSWGKGVANNGEPHNTFSALGNEEYVNANEWNYYTITFANDWIQVYVNGKEMVYTVANIDRGYSKYFNSGYLTRYNTVGIWNNEMLAAKGDPSEATLEGTERNYLTKSGFYYDLDAPDQAGADGSIFSALSDKGANTGKDSASVRANMIYQDPWTSTRSTETGKYALLMDTLTINTVKMYFGGVGTAISLDEEYFFTALQMTSEDANSEEVRSRVHFADFKYQTDEATGEETDIELPASRCKFFFSDHMLDAGTQVSGMSSYMEELTAEEVKANYEVALESKPQ